MIRRAHVRAAMMAAQVQPDGDRSAFDPDEVALIIDLYELTMAASYFELGFNDRRVSPECAADAAEARLSGGGRAGAAARGARRVPFRASGASNTRFAPLFS